MDEIISAQGTTSIAPDVLSTIAHLTTLGVPGVSRMSPSHGAGMNNLLKRRHVREGIYIEVLDDIVYADIFVVVMSDLNVREISHNIQHDVSRAISEMVGMQVGRINIHVEDIDYSSETEALPS